MWNSVPNSGANIHKKGKLIAQIPFLFDFFHAFFMKLTKQSVYSKNILYFLILIFLPIESAVSARETGVVTSTLSSGFTLPYEVRSFTASPPAGGPPQKAWQARGVWGEHRMADNCLASRIYPFLPYNLLSSPPPRFELGSYRGVCVMAAKKGGYPNGRILYPILYQEIIIF